MFYSVITNEKQIVLNRFRCQNHDTYVGGLPRVITLLWINLITLFFSQWLRTFLSTRACLLYKNKITRGLSTLCCLKKTPSIRQLHTLLDTHTYYTYDWLKDSYSKGEFNWKTLLNVKCTNSIHLFSSWSVKIKENKESC